MTGLLSLQSITKAYPGVLANDAVDFDVQPGEIHALLGENGAGKSTLMKVLSGQTKPDGGRIIWKGDETSIASPQASKALGIGMVHQHFALFDGMSVGENVALGLRNAADARSARRDAGWARHTDSALAAGRPWRRARDAHPSPIRPSRP